jgi:hypothetical protein
LPLRLLGEGLAWSIPSDKSTMDGKLRSARGAAEVERGADRRQEQFQFLGVASGRGRAGSLGWTTGEKESGILAQENLGGRWELRPVWYGFISLVQYSTATIAMSVNRSLLNSCQTCPVAACADNFLLAECGLWAVVNLGSSLIVMDVVYN